MNDIKFKINSDERFEDAVENGTYLTDGKKEFFFLPYWFEKTEGGYFAHQLGRLPEVLVKLIEDMRYGWDGTKLIDLLMQQTFHHDDESARPIVDEFVKNHPEILDEYDIEYLYKI